MTAHGSGNQGLLFTRYRKIEPPLVKQAMPVGEGKPERRATRLAEQRVIAGGLGNQGLLFTRYRKI